MKKLNALCLLVLLSMVGCDTDSPTAPVNTAPPAASTPSTPAADPQPANANLEFTGTYVCTDPFCDFADFDLRLRNTGGVGANLNFIRVENRLGQPILELGADHFINAFGNNRIEAGQTLDFVLHAQLGYVLVIGYRDDNGVKGEVRLFPDLPR